MRLRAVFFDMDGTMVEPASTTRFLLHACRKLDLPFNPDQIDQARRTAGTSWVTDFGDYRLQTREAFIQLNYKFLVALGVQRDLHPLAVRMQHIWDHYPDEIEEKLYPEVRRVLQSLREKALALGVVSHRHHVLSRASLKRHKLEGEFACVVSPQAAGAPRGKLDPQMWQYALLQVGASAAEVLHVDDDYDVGVRGAHDAGIRAVLIDRTGLRPTLPEAEVVRSLDDLLPLLESPRDHPHGG